MEPAELSSLWTQKDFFCLKFSLDEFTNLSNYFTFVLQIFTHAVLLRLCLFQSYLRPVNQRPLSYIDKLLTKSH